MPVKLSSPSPHEPEARIEIIPLIDIMFFLLASFMLVSLSMVTQRSVKVNLPEATMATSDKSSDVMKISVDQAGLAYVDKQSIPSHELVQRLMAWRRTNEQARVFICGDRQARHGDMMRVLDLVRTAGIQKVAFEARTPDSTSSPSP